MRRSLCILCAACRVNFDAHDPDVIGVDASACAPAPDLLAYYPFDEVTGTVAHDLASAANDGFFIGNPSWATGKIGGALATSKAGDMVGLPMTPALSFANGLGSLTIALWLNPRSLTNTADIRPLELALCRDDAYLFVGLGASGRVELGLYDEKQAHNVNANSLPDVMRVGEWTHVALVFDRAANALTTYINGVANGFVGDGSGFGKLDCSTATMASVGGWVGQFEYNGLVDDLRIYGRALTAQDAADLAARTVTSCQ